MRRHCSHTLSCNSLFLLKYIKMEWCITAGQSTGKAEAAVLVKALDASS